MGMKMPNIDEIFKKFDTNGDGSISKDEFAAGVKKVHELIQAHIKQMGSPFGAPGFGAWGMRPPFGVPGKGPQAGPLASAGVGPKAGPPQGLKRPGLSELFDRFDKNKDGKLTKDEVPAPLWERISKADANHDGAVTKEELESARKKMEEQRTKDKEKPADKK